MAEMELDDKTIDNLNDFRAAIDLMKSSGLNYDKITSLEDAKDALRNFIPTQKEVTGDGANESNRLIQKLMEENRIAREELQSLVNQCKEMVDKLPDASRDDLQTAYPAPKKELDNIIRELDVNECVILVAGETSAGKSTLLNLLIGELNPELLPVAHLPSTSVITELRYSPKRKMVVHNRDPAVVPITMDLHPDTAAETISKYVHQKSEGGRTSAEYNKVEVYWPCEWLQGGITIVDSPGVGEDDELTEMVKQYLPKAFGFMFVINTPNAGGIAPDRLQDLIFSHLTMQREGSNSQFNPRSAVFVCNKWDEVEAAGRSNLKDYVIEKLQEVWEGFTKEQVFFISAKQAINALHKKRPAKDYDDLVKGIAMLVPVGLKTRLSEQFSVPWKMLDRCVLSLQSFQGLAALSKPDIEEKIREGHARLQKLALEPYKLEKKLKTQMEQGIDEAMASLRAHLDSPETRQRLCTWDDCDSILGSKSGTIQSLKEKMVEEVTKRINGEIDRWNKEHKVFQKIQDELMMVFKKEYGSIEVELRSIEHNCMCTSNNEPTIYQKTNDESGPTDAEVIVLIAITAPIWIPASIIMAIIVLPIAGIMVLADKAIEAIKLRKMKKNITQRMAEQTKEVIDQMLTSDSYRKVFQDHLNRLKSLLQGLLQEIPRLIAADIEILEKMKQELKATQEKGSATREGASILSEVRNLLTSMKSLYYSSIKIFDVDFHALSNFIPLGEGALERIYTAEWSRSKGSPSCAVVVKEMKLPLNSSNTTRIMQEEEQLRRVQSGHVLSFHGTGISQQEDGVHPFFVMEYFSGTLADLVYSPKYKAPARCNGDMSMAAWYACQVCAGLDELHGNGFLQRDLRLESIIVDNDGVVKLADLMFNQQDENMLSYMAPEVGRPPYDKKGYDKKAEMFSYGMVLLELWYGKRITKGNLEESKSKADSSELKPNGDYQQLIAKCHSEEPHQRPTANECYKIITNIFEKTTADM